MTGSLHRNAPRKPRRPKRMSWIKLIVFILVLSIAALVGGFLSFTYHISQQSLPNPTPKADGIVVWTGSGGKRLETGAALLSGGYGERLLISGVNSTTSRESLQKLLGIDEAKSKCCLDLDYRAEDTVGNARETSSWAKALGYEHIILVTSAYHMPRAQMEIQNKAGRIKITPYPVISATPTQWWESRKAFGRFTREYGKLIRAMLLSPREKSDDKVPMLTPTPQVKPTNSESRPSAPSP